MKRYGFITFILFLVSGSVNAEAFKSGEYVTDSGWGQLLISKPKKEGIPFAIQSMGGNGHICDLSGLIVNGKSRVSYENGNEVCLVSFTLKPSGIEVVANTVEECRYSCGTNAGFEGFYLTLPKGCAQADRQLTRKQFKLLYQKKNYKQAILKLSPILKNCSTTLEFIELGETRNDLAITQYKNKLYDACLKTLEPYAQEAALDDDEAVSNYPSLLAERYLPIIKAARTNIRLCGVSKTKENKQR